MKLNEAGLSGTSRSKQMSNWDAYVLTNPDWSTIEYYVEKDDYILDADGNKSIQVNKNDPIIIRSPELKKIGRSNYAEIETMRGVKGYLPIGSITKPTGKSKNKDASAVIPGGKNSKEYTPDKLGLAGQTYTADSLVAAAKQGVGSSPENIREFLFDCVGSLVNKKLFEEKATKFVKVVDLSKKHSVDEGDMKILSKNFGEVLAGLFVLVTNKKINKIEFPIEINEGLYDFVGFTNRNEKHYYSVKAAGGSSTAMKNMNAILKHFRKVENIKNIDRLQMLMTTPENKTVDLILNYINDFEPSLARDICSILNIPSLSHDALSGFLKTYQDQKSFEDFMLVLSKVYTLIDYKPTMATLKSIYETPKDKSKNGYVVYALGSYIVKSLNSDKKMVDLLNDVLNLASFVEQITCDLTNTQMKFTIKGFDTNRFKFSYNGMMKAPGNRPLGFMQA